MNTKSILILTASYGDGHIKTARSLTKKINNLDSSIDVKTIDLFHEAHPLINKAIKYLYLKCYSRAPKMYGLLYYSTKDIRRNFYINNLIGMFGKQTLKKFLETLKPDIVINTFPVLAMPILYKKGRTKTPCYTIVTDYGIHSQWIDPGISKYFVGNESLKKDMLRQGVDEKKIEVTGIPVCLECESIDKSEFYKKYGISNKDLPIITVLAGANGVLRNMPEICRMLNAMNPQAQFIIVCGKNKSLKENLEKIAPQLSERIKVFGFVDNLHEIMKSSDIVVSKAGGITTTEALNMGIPLIVFGTPAGQENENTKFLTEKGCSYHAKNINDLIEILSRLLLNPSILANMKSSMNTICKPKGCDEIVNYIVKELKNEKSITEIGSIETDSVFNFS